MDVIVIGAGVIGLSTAYRLLEAGHRVLIVAQQFTATLNHNYTDQTRASDSHLALVEEQRIASDVSAGSFIPHTADPTPDQRRWLTATAQAFYQLISDHPEAGVTLVPGSEFFNEIQFKMPWWTKLVINFRAIEVSSMRTIVAENNYTFAFAFDTPLANPSVYLPWLHRRVEQMGGKFIKRKVETMDEVMALYPSYRAIINCSGLGSRELVKDTTMTPVYGMMLRVQVNGIDEWARDTKGVNKLSYIYPRAADTLLGGIAREGETKSQNRTDDARGIITRCTRLNPKAATGRVVEVLEGCRPKRKDGIRLESEPLVARNGQQTLVIHNYGHGGEGYCFSWGTADAVVGILAQHKGSVPPASKL